MHTIIQRAAPIITGILFWHMWSGMHCITRTFSVPVCFYNTTPDTALSAPEMLTVSLRARRPLLATINRSQLAIHIDAMRFEDGPNRLRPTADDLFLPDGIKLVHCTPYTLIAHRTRITNTDHLTHEPINQETTT